MANELNNVTTKVSGDTLTLTIDLSENLGLTQNERSIKIANAHWVELTGKGMPKGAKLHLMLIKPVAKKNKKQTDNEDEGEDEEKPARKNKASAKKSGKGAKEKAKPSAKEKAKPSRKPSATKTDEEDGGKGGEYFPKRKRAA